MRRGRAGAVVAALILLLSGSTACRQDARTAAGESPQGGATPAASASYAGRQACASCHQEQDRRFGGSHHDLAMQEPSATSVLGNFNGATFTYAGTTSRFTRRDGQYFVRTDGPDGSLQDFSVAYVFGVYPLQQYLIGFPDGRYQALGIAWDARPKAAGGQRWFHLYPDERVTHDDPLHWTQFSQNWNAQCATCHSTNLRKGFDRIANRYATTWSELDVSCEACHGPGSSHVAWAQQPSRTAGPVSPAEMGLTASLRDRQGVSWSMQPTGIAHRSMPGAATRAEVEVCAPCHSRRVERAEGHVPGTPWLTTYRPSVLSDGLYRADGRMQDEVYVYGSFAQSRMYAAGVTCADCHDPHSLTLRAEGNAVCAQCHAPATFDIKAHHGHEPGTAGASCVACHMPSETYMGVDRRHDHGFRIPRPDLAVSLGLRDSCTQCHDGRTPQWAAAALDRWRSPRWRQRPEFAAAFSAARAGRASAAPAIEALASDPAQPAIVRATAVELLPRTASPQTETVIERLAADPDPVVRGAVAQVLGALAPASRARIGGRLLDDPFATIRIDAAQALAGESAQWLSGPLGSSLQRAIVELRASENFNGDRPESHLTLGGLAEAAGDVPQAMREYGDAINRFPWFVPAYVNLADLQRQGGDEATAEATLRRALKVAPDDPGVLYALGLGLYRQGRGGDAVDVLARASLLAPATSRYALAHGLALDAQGRRADARAVLGRALQRHPDDAELREALASLAGPSSTPTAPAQVR
ncbi:MAG TPA: tetratricopeptide repeat protein [Luteitalea sp.]|nr:tetratricopeptide repeat protein [Luteitalea sp.]